MTAEEFLIMTQRCQPHTIFSSDWQSFRSGEYADNLLPNAGLIYGTALHFYDGAEILPKECKFIKKIIQITESNDLVVLTIFSYPKGVKAEQKKKYVLSQRNELCLFFEIDINNKISIYANSGSAVTNILSSVFGTDKNVTSFFKCSYGIETKLSDFQTSFNDEFSHYKVVSYIGEQLGIDISKTLFEIKIGPIQIHPSEPHVDKSKGRRNSPYLQIDFEIINQSATSYSIYVYDKKGKELYQMSYLPEIKVADKGKSPINVFLPGKYSINLDCSNYMILLELYKINSIIIRIEAQNAQKKTAFAQTEVSVKALIEKIQLVSKYIIVLDESDNELKVFASEIVERQKKFIKRIPINVYSNLDDRYKLILNMPVIMTKLGWLYGALCQIHWLEGSGKSLKFPYEFFMSEERVENVDIKSLVDYFSNMEFLSKEGSQDNNNFLYNDEMTTVKESLNLFEQNLQTRQNDCEIGNSPEKLILEKKDWDKIRSNPNLKAEYVNENFFQSFELGDYSGNWDDIGAALGKYSLRCYYQGHLHKDIAQGFWILNIEKVRCRFFDDFCFDDDSPFGSQYLGSWKFDVENPEKPSIIPLMGNWFVILNKNYRILRKFLHKYIKKSCADFFIYSPFKTIDDEFLKKSIRI